MTDKEKLDAIRAEIHRLVDVRGYDREMANDLFAFMDSLPNELVSEELEEAAKRYGIEGDEISGLYIIDEEVEAFKAGAKWQKEQMIAKAIDGEILEMEDNDCAICSHTHLELCIEPDTLEKNGFKDNDKVKVIVINED